MAIFTIKGGILISKADRFHWKDKLVIVEPCIDDENLVMGELLLGSPIITHKNDDIVDFKGLCSKIHKNKEEFQKIRCSEKLGIVTFSFLERKVTITKRGRITIHRAMDKKDLLQIAKGVVNFLVKNRFVLIAQIDN